MKPDPLGHSALWNAAFHKAFKKLDPSVQKILSDLINEYGVNQGISRHGSILFIQCQTKEQWSHLLKSSEEITNNFSAVVGTLGAIVIYLKDDPFPLNGVNFSEGNWLTVNRFDSNQDIRCICLECKEHPNWFLIAWEEQWHQMSSGRIAESSI